MEPPKGDPPFSYGVIAKTVPSPPDPPSLPPVATALYGLPYTHTKKQVSDGTDFINAIALGRKALSFTDSSQHWGSKWTYPGLKRSHNHTSSQGLSGYALYGIAAYPPEAN
jgi:hypothetical protein